LIYLKKIMSSIKAMLDKHDENRYCRNSIKKARLEALTKEDQYAK